jgi:hypothetical protein
LACAALSAFWFTVEVSSSIDAAVSSSELACDSVRADKSILPEAISPEAVAMVSALRRISPMVSASRACIDFIANRMLASSVAWVLIGALRSPPAICSATLLT